jgi:hypothetical protein
MRSKTGPVSETLPTSGYQTMDENQKLSRPDWKPYMFNIKYSVVIRGLELMNIEIT